MYLKSGEKEECFGCFSCSDICPTGAIKKEIEKDGFYYPTLNSEKCVQCQKCEFVCPVNIESRQYKIPLRCFAGKIKERNDFNNSASGGAFKAIVKACMVEFGNRFKVFYCAGCTYKDNFQVVHDVTPITDNLSVDIFCKSKYVQSNTQGIFKRCKEILSDTYNFLIFTGTPCQCAALKCYLGQKYNNVLYVDIICHGAPSQNDFDQYRENLEDTYQSKLITYEFRTKKELENGTIYTRSARYVFENGVERRLNRLEDEYLLSFYSKTYQSRSSCDCCTFKRPERISDITIGDAWGINEIYENLIPTRGVSIVILTTDIALKLVKNIRTFMDTYDVEYDFVVQHNEALRKKENL
jgi:NAD-dependent dihydropyrimidine dehydrogenase PreA subunit